MPRFAEALFAFNGGELSPRLEGRADLDHYRASASRLENFIPLVTGPLFHRSGTRFVKAVKDSSKTTVLIPFTVSTIAAYAIEAGDLYFRFYTSEARLENPPNTPVELVTTYAHTDLRQLQYAQSADTLYLVHPSYPPRKLVRVTSTSFAITNVDFQDGPYLDENIDTVKVITPSAGTGSVTLTASGAGNTPFDPARDVGRHVRLRTTTQVGWLQITAVTNSTTATATVRGGIVSGGVGYTAWRLGAWYVGNYPRAVTFNEQRLCFAGAPNTIQRVDLSVTGDFERFSPTGAGDDATAAYSKDTVADDNAISFTIGSNELNAILWLRVHRVLSMGTSQSLFEMAASTQQEALTPTNVNVREEDTAGASAVLPGRLANNIIFAGRAGQSILSAGFSIDDDGTRVSDLTELADHITGGSVVQIAVAKEPFPLVWIINGEGGLASLTFQPLQKVFGWARHPIGGSTLGSDNGLVRSIAVLPIADQDQLWTIVERRINGATVQYVEFLEDPYRVIDFDAAQEEAFFVDSGVSYDTPKTITGATQANPVVISSAAHGFNNGDVVRITKIRGMVELNGRSFTVANVAAGTFELSGENGLLYAAYASGGEARLKAVTFSGLSHLEGQTVQILADGACVPDAVVSGGAVTLPSSASHVHIGLGRRAVYQSTRLESPDPAGSSLGKRRQIDTVVLRLLETLGGSLGLEEDKLNPLLYRTARDEMDAAPPLFTGEIRMAYPGGWTSEPRIFVEQTQPLPMTLLAVVLQGEGAPR